MLNAWIFICRISTFAFLAGHLYRVKSWLYRYLFEQKYLLYQVSVYRSLEELAAFVKTLIWTADSWQQLWDAISYPEKVEYVARYGDRKVGDCDEFAIYISNALIKSVAFGALQNVANPRLLTVSWMKGWKPGGHNVCLIEFPENRPTQRFGYMDYGMPIYGPTEADVVKKVLARYAPKGVCLVWAISDAVSLKPLETHWGV